MNEASRIMNNCATMPGYHGSTTAAVVDEILNICGGQIMCRGSLREIEFTPITKKSFLFKTVNWHDKHIGRTS